MNEMALYAKEPHPIQTGFPGSLVAYALP